MKISVHVFRLTSNSFHQRVVCCSKFTTSHSSPTKNYYQILNVATTASREEIKTAFLDLSKKYHPDKNHTDPKAHDHYLEIQEAYRVLMKDGSRKFYDDTLKYTSTRTTVRMKEYEGKENLKRRRNNGFSWEKRGGRLKSKREDYDEDKQEIKPQSWAVSDKVVPVAATMLFIIAAIPVIDSLMEYSKRK